MVSVVIAAHNEAGVIGRCLGSLIGQETGGDDLDVTVVANGCTDETAAIAREFGVRVIEVPEANKAVALNHGDAAARGFPRIYLDADITVPRGAIASFDEVLTEGSPVLAAVPRRQLDLAGRPAFVRAYFTINSQLPAFAHGLFGRGMIALSQRGRERFDMFPNLVADDLFLDSLFAEREKRTLDAVEVVVAAPWRTSALVRRLVRVRRGNAAMRQAGRDGTAPLAVRRADRLAWLQAVVFKQPQLAPAGVAYVLISAVAAALARWMPRSGNLWERDESTRRTNLTAGDAHD